MAFGVGKGQDDIEGSFSNWFPDMQKDPIEKLIEELNNFILLKNPKFRFHIDKEGKFCIYSRDSKESKKSLYEGHVYNFIYDLMKYFNVRNEI